MIVRKEFNYKRIECMLKNYKALKQELETDLDMLDKEKDITKKSELIKKIDKASQKKTYIDLLLSGLVLQERMVLEIYYIENQTWRDVSRLLNRTEGWGRKIRKKAIEKMVRIASI